MSDYKPDEEGMNASLGKDGCSNCKQLQAENKRLKVELTEAKASIRFLSQYDSDIDGLQAEIKRLKETIKEIRAKINEIIYHHTKPRNSRHGNTTNICEDIKSRILIALKDK